MIIERLAAWVGRLTGWRRGAWRSSPAPFRCWRWRRSISGRFWRHWPVLVWLIEAPSCGAPWTHDPAGFPCSRHEPPSWDGVRLRLFLRRPVLDRRGIPRRSRAMSPCCRWLSPRCRRGWRSSGLRRPQLAARLAARAFRVLALALTLAIAEWLRGHVLTGFPWNTLGYALTLPLRFMQSASVVGIYGLGLIALLVLAAPLVARVDLGRAESDGTAMLVATSPPFSPTAPGVSPGPRRPPRPRRTSASFSRAYRGGRSGCRSTSATHFRPASRPDSSARAGARTAPQVSTW